MTDKPVISVILGGGRGTRLEPLTRMRSKPAVPVGGKYRLVDIPISNCLNSGLRKIFVLTQFNSASLNRHIKNTYHFDVFGHGFVDILAAEQTVGNQNWFQGTADAVRQTLHHLENFKYEHVLILSGDQLYQMDFNAMIENHVKSGSQLTIATIPVNAHDATGFGIMKTNEEHIITSFIEKPSTDILSNWTSDTGEAMKAQGKEYLASMGIYIFNRQTLIDLFDLSPSAKDFGKEIIPMAMNNPEYRIGSYIYDGYWTDIGTISSFFEANLELTDIMPRFNLFDNESPIYSRARMLPASKIRGTTLDRVVVSDGCIIEANKITHSVVGIRSRIGMGTNVSDSIIMGNDYFVTNEEFNTDHHESPLIGIGENCTISTCIVDKNAKIGNNVTIQGGNHLQDQENDLYWVRDGIVIIPKGVTIPNNTRI